MVAAVVALSSDRRSITVKSFSLPDREWGSVRAIPKGRWSKKERTFTFPLALGTGRALYRAIPASPSIKWDENLIEALKNLPRPIALKNIEIVPELAGDFRINKDAPLLREYQKIGISFMLKNPRCINGDVMAAGKTVQSIIASELSGAPNTLVVCPGYLIGNWYAEIKKWTARIATVIEAKQDLSKGQEELRHATATAIALASKRTKFCIVNYDMLLRTKQIAEIDWGCVIADEATELKNRTTKRAKIFHRLRSNSVYLLTGTPMLNRPIELYSLLDIVAPGAFGSFWDFGDRYATAYHCPKCDLTREDLPGPCPTCKDPNDAIPGKRIPRGAYCPDCEIRRLPPIKTACPHCGSKKHGEMKWDVRKDYTGANRIPELRDRVAALMIRRELGDVVKELPNCPRIDSIVTLPDVYQRKYDVAATDLVQYLMQHKKKSFDAAMRSASNTAMRRANELRQILSEAKVSAAAEAVMEKVKNGEHVVVFTCYRRTAELLSMALRNPGMFSDYLKEQETNHSPIELETDFEGEDFSEADGLDEKLRFVPIGEGGFPAVYVHTGRYTTSARSIAIMDFKAARPGVLICTVQSAGMGLNLAEAASTFFIDLPWRPSDIFQAEGRTSPLRRPSYHETGILTPSFYFRLFANDTYDQVLMQRLIEKQDVFDQLFGESDNLKIKASFKTDNLLEDLLRHVYETKVMAA